MRGLCKGVFLGCCHRGSLRVLSAETTYGPYLWKALRGHPWGAEYLRGLSSGALVFGVVLWNGGYLIFGDYLTYSGGLWGKSKGVYCMRGYPSLGLVQGIGGCLRGVTTGDYCTYGVLSTYITLHLLWGLTY